MTQSQTKANSENANDVQGYKSYQTQGAAPTHTPDEELELLKKRLAGRYQVIKKLGKGSQGSVFLAKSLETQQKVAIKQLHIPSVKDWKQYDLFQREADVLQRLDIPGVAKLHETIEMLDIPTPMALIVQDYIEGEPLQQFIAQGHRFQIDQIGSILLQLLDILQKLHESDPEVIHRDIKPSNILLNYTENSQTPEVHLIDFGAVSNPQVKGGGSTVVGTYGYMSPEQLMGRACAASDIYSLAIVTVYLLSGVPPEELEIQDYHVLIDSHLEHLPYAITAFLRKMLEPRVEDRMTDYDQIRKFFTALKSQKFDEIPKIDAIKSQKKYSLNEVYSYHQPGNIVLWQELEDTAPRTLPKQYKQKSFKDVKLSTLFITIPCLFITAMFFLASLSFLGNTLVDIIFCILFLLMGVASGISFVVQIIDALNPYLTRLHFFKNARKSMATIIRISYISPFEEQFCKAFVFNHPYHPTWRITYSFNPPDDSSPDNLIRTVETHVKPDIKEGDLIPILYLIHKGKLGEKNTKTTETQEFVYSTPYPIPVSDDFNPSEK